MLCCERNTHETCGSLLARDDSIPPLHNESSHEETRFFSCVCLCTRDGWQEKNSFVMMSLRVNHVFLGGRLLFYFLRNNFKV